MNIFSRVQNKLENEIGNETIGDYGFEKNRPQSDVPSKNKKVKKEKSKKELKQKEKTKKEKIKKEKPKKEELIKDSMTVFNIPKIEEDTFQIPKLPETIELPTKNKKYPVLELLGISKDVDFSHLISVEDIENAEFSLTAPTGLDPREVEVFCNKLEHDIAQYRAIILNRQEDFVKLLDEVLKLENQLIEKQQESELASFIIDQKSTEEKLKEELLELRLENQELRYKVAQLNKKSIEFKPDPVISEPLTLEESTVVINNDIPMKVVEKPKVALVKEDVFVEEERELLSIDKDSFDSVLDELGT